MGEACLPATVRPFGPFMHLGVEAHELTVQGRNAEALRLAERHAGVVAVLGDDRTAALLAQTRMYAHLGLGQFEEALAIGESLLRRHKASGARCSEAKVLADMSGALIQLGRLDEGLHRLARAAALVEYIARANPRYTSALSSIGEAARTAELYELADECAELAVRSFGGDTTQLAGTELQHAELLLEWGLRLEQVGQCEEAGVRFARGTAIVRRWAEYFREHGGDGEAPLASALLALGLAKTGATDEALRLCGSTVVPLRAAGRTREARLVHLAYGVALRDLGDLAAARREFVAAEELSVAAGHTTQRLLFQYELAVLAAAELPGEAASALLAALRGQARWLWNLRMDRRSMLRQARQRVWLEAEHARADTAAGQDALTGLGNRRQFDAELAGIAQSPAAGSVVLLLVDLDRFKAINDRFSHGVGDRVLREVAAVLRAHCRHDDVPVRFGGDEFALFLRTDLITAKRIGERIRRAVAARDWSEFAPGLRVTLSIGVAGLSDGMDGHDLFDSADRNLYAAKRRGRDQLAA